MQFYLRTMKAWKSRLIHPLQWILAGSLCSSAWSIPVQGDLAEWRHTGLGGGGAMNRIAFDPKNPDLVYVGTDVTGLFRSHDRGASWQASRTGLNHDYIQDISVSPTLNEIYVATLAGIARSIDGGVSWETELDLMNGSQWLSWSEVTIDTLDPTVAWAGMGVFRFSDADGSGQDPDWVFERIRRKSAGQWEVFPRISPANNSLKAGSHGGLKGLLADTAAAPSYGSAADWNGSSIYKDIPLDDALLEAFATPGTVPSELALVLEFDPATVVGEASAVLSSGAQAGQSHLVVGFLINGIGFSKVIPPTVLRTVSRTRTTLAGGFYDLHTESESPIEIGSSNSSFTQESKRAFMEFDTQVITNELLNGATVHSMALSLSIESASANSTGEVHARPIPRRLDDYGATPAIHTILPDPLDFDESHPGADRIYVSTTAGVFMASWSAGAQNWTWIDIGHGLPHNSCRDMEPAYGENGGIEGLYLALNSEWDGIDSNTIYDHHKGFGGGVWYTEALASPIMNWRSVDQGMNLHDGVFKDGVLHPKNIRHLAINPNDKTLYTALTVRRKANEGVWRSANAANGSLWERMTESRCSQPGYNIEFDHFPTLGAIDGLEVDPETNDVYFTTIAQAYRCPGGDCLPQVGANYWESLHTNVTTEATELPCTGDLFSTTGMDVTKAFHLISDPQNPSHLFLSYFDQGLVLSEDRGQTWKPLYPNQSMVPLPGEVLDPTDEKNCGGIFPNPDPVGSGDEWFGIFGNWQSENQLCRFYTKLWYKNGTPDGDGDGLIDDWIQLELPAPPGLESGPCRVNDVLFVDGEHVLVATDVGVYRGTRFSGIPATPWDRYSFVFDGRDLDHSQLGRHATDLIAESGSSANRRVWVSYRYESSVQHGGVVFGDALGSTWTEGQVQWPASNVSNVFALTKSKTNQRLYAANASAGVGSNGQAGVLVSSDGGLNWQVDQAAFFSPSGDPQDAYDLGDIDVVGIATLEIPFGAFQPGGPNTFERLFVAIAPREGNNSQTPGYSGEIFGGVFASDDHGASFTPRSDGLDAADAIFLLEDENAPLTLFLGTDGNGAYFLDELPPPSSGGGGGHAVMD